MDNYNEEGLINIGVGDDISIADLALLIKDIVGFEGNISFDSSKPDGTPRKGGWSRNPQVCSRRIFIARMLCI